MPSHKSVQDVCKLRDSKGRLITALMWRANRLVDALAKLSATLHRLPEEALRKVDIARQLVKYEAAKLGVVTHRANNHKVTGLDEGGAITTKTARDSTAQSQRRSPQCGLGNPNATQGRSSSGERLTATANHHSFAISSLPGRVTAPVLHEGALHAAGQKRKGNFGTNVAAQALARKRGRIMAHSTLREDANEQQLLAKWIATRDLAPHAGPSAQQRLDELRARLKARAATSPS